jgi:hypothetical protein
MVGGVDGRGGFGSLEGMRHLCGGDYVGLR